MQLLIERLRTEGYCVVENQEPGATAIGKQIRRIFLDPENHEMAPMTELLLVFASRAQAAAEIVLPALEAGHIVVSDRFTDSTLAYQGAARGIGFDAVRRAHDLALGTLWPDRTICITVDLVEGLQRAHQRNRSAVTCESRIDEHSLDFHRRVADGYRQIALEEPQRFRMVDGSGGITTVAERVWHEVQPALPQRF